MDGCRGVGIGVGWWCQLRGRGCCGGCYGGDPWSLFYGERKKVSVLRQRPRKGKRRLWSAEVGFADGGWFWVVVADGVWVTVAHD